MSYYPEWSLVQSNVIYMDCKNQYVHLPSIVNIFYWCNLCHSRMCSEVLSVETRGLISTIQLLVFFLPFLSGCRFAEDGANFSINTDDPMVTGHELQGDYDLVHYWGLTEARLIRAVSDTRKILLSLQNSVHNFSQFFFSPLSFLYCSRVLSQWRSTVCIFSQWC
jgi:hypothetical protein